MKKNENNFKGFSNSLLEFLTQLEKNNNKDWFHENKITYENVMKNPVREFVDFMSQKFADENLSFIADKKKSLFRVNRDIRFSKNKDPYKTNLGVFFPYTLNQTKEKAPDSVGLYFHIEREMTFVAGGLKMPSSPNLLRIRERIADEWQGLEKIITNKKFQKNFPIIFEGESLKRIPRGFPKDHPRENWLRLKEYIVWRNITHKEALGPNLADMLIKDAKIIEPFLEFLNGALE